jgi:DNA helicase-2/ATP-dependent DNA helicase PcrA
MMPATRMRSSANVELDERQRKVVEAATDQRLLVLAGPGSGKTEVSAQRICNLIARGLRSSEILVLSFSRSAVRILTDRLERIQITDNRIQEELRHLVVRTFDSWTYRVLKSMGQRPRDLLQNYDGNIEKLVSLLCSSGPTEADDRFSHIKHVIVDEMQDLAGVRGDLVVELLRTVAPPGACGTGFTLLGDPAQSIYGFSNRSSEYKSQHGDTTKELLDGLRNSYRDQLEQVSLSRNYRSVTRIEQRIGRLRQVIIGTEKTPIDKLLYAREVFDRFPQADFGLDREMLCHPREQSMAMLARTNGEVLRIAQKLFGTEEQGPGIAFRIGRQDDTGAAAWVAGLLARVKATEISKEIFAQIYERARAPGAGTAAAISAPSIEVAWDYLSEAVSGHKDATSLDMAKIARCVSWPGALPIDDYDESAPLCISTIHQSKGREFDEVAILEPQPRADESEQPDEEAAVIFVALSRAAQTVARLPSNSIYSPPTHYVVDGGGRERLVSWRNDWVNCQLGVQGDVCKTSFADVEIHGTEEAVDQNFDFLARNMKELAGRKVLLIKEKIPGSELSRYRYEIRLQEDGQPGRLLGAMNQVVVTDLLAILYSKGYTLPARIMNLRIARIVSLHDIDADGVRIGKKFERSRLWLGAELFGTGDFRPYKYSRGDS